MSYCILCRTQRGALVAITTIVADEEVIAEYEYGHEALEVAENNLACQSGDFEIIELTV